MEAIRVPGNFPKSSCDLAQGWASPQHTSSCLRKHSDVGTSSLTHPLKNLNSQSGRFKAVFEGGRSSQFLRRFNRNQLLSWDSYTGHGGPAYKLGAANSRISEPEMKQGSSGSVGFSFERKNFRSIASIRVLGEHSSTNVCKSDSFNWVLKGRNRFCLTPICGVENRVALEVVLEAPPPNSPLHSPEAAALESASYLESLSSPRAELGNRSSKATQTLTSLKKTILHSSALTDMSPFRPGHLVECFEVEGRRRLSGEVNISGAKNSALAVLAGAICSEGQVYLEMIPDLHDVRRMFQVLQSVGVKVQRASSGFMIDAKDLTSVEPCSEAVRKLRASFFVIGALLGRKGEAVVPLPGGCNIGARPIDLHVRGLEALGADIEIRQGKVFGRALNGRNLTGGSFFLDYPSVGATETLMMAAALADGHTTLSNVAQEPEVVDLANFLNSCGACIQGAGTNTLSISGIRKLHGTEYCVIPDRIEAGTFLIAAAITRSSISMNPVIPKHLASVIEKLRTIGCQIQVTRSDSLRINCAEMLRSCNVKTLPYPGFPTDLQPQLMSLLTTCSGQSVLEETVFEGRMRQAEELQKLGAQIKMSRNIAIINGKETGSLLYGAPVLATDLRAGAALVLAGLSAEGTTYIEGISHIDRGYEKLDLKLRLLGASIQRAPCLPAELTLE
ncbi:uncharacterized protein [Physcomitrium patens]|uniref:UDP-N-acetylglucosamine 1-carboxyvinyltransferase n=1 Tax=Physcomitrium patens TaxID=3218 RepID=A9SPB7_PHYPA|nr:uncharacterized protein LOC112275125 isoform X1 [Physcomitrium patens]|eukprot:XP_024360944.1 uncharacterized protein LOC112275125 isoform X1 [Physcomitrella patens]